MTLLQQIIEIEPRDVRAVDVEADAERLEPLAGYVVSAHVLDAVRQVTIGWQDGPRTRAWSVTGPFGAGKSAFVHFLQALLASDQAALRARADHLLRDADAQLAWTLDRERRRLADGPHGFILAVVRGQREPAAETVTRALAAGVTRHWRGRKLPTVAREIVNAAETGIDRQGAGEMVLDWVRRISERAPVLLVLDELGKILEHAHSRNDDADLFVLQQLAEWFSGQDNCRGGLLTLQHLAYEDYLTGVSEARRREWRKVQGRFADLPFIADAQHGHRLLAGSLNLTAAATPAIRKRLAAACEQAEQELHEAAPEALMPSAATGDPAATYPLHPAAAAALPTLAARYGQHDRTLIAFLSGESPAALRALLGRTQITKGTVGFVRLAELYDAVIGDPVAAHAPGADGALLREARARIEDEPGLGGLELEVAKTVAVLNLVAGRRSLRADVAVIEASCAGPGPSPSQLAAVRGALDGLVARGLLVWRQFAGEYRVWRGSDIDLDALVADERDRLAAARDHAAEIALLSSTRPPRAQVARRHSVEHGLLRFFETRYATEVPAELRCHTDGADGLILTVLSDQPAPAKLPASTTDGRPLVIVYTEHGREPLDAVLDAAAVARVLEESEELAGDPVARREARHRASMARDAVSGRLDAALDPARPGVCWYVAGRSRPAARPADLSRQLSDLCDARYPHSPRLRTEMLNRRDLTSQGAKARGELMRAMFEHTDTERLGMRGHGPEASMYRAVLEHTGLHARREDRLSFGEPNRASGLRPVWKALGTFFDEAIDRPRPLSELWTQLASPPYGMKEGPIPVLLAAALLDRQDDVFLYQDGTFVPSVGPADLERLLKAPERYSVKQARLLGLRAEVFRELRHTLISGDPTVALRNATTLAVVRPLLKHVKSLTEYAQQTEKLRPSTIAVRDALLSATEPDTLLFEALPAACGIAPLSAEEPADRERAQAFVAALRSALQELSGVYELLVSEVSLLLREAFKTPRSQPSVREDLRARSAHLVEHVIDPRGRGFLSSASHSDDQTTDQEWTEAMALNISVKPLGSWNDGDLQLFEAALAERAAWFHRLESLHADLRPQGPGGFTTQLVTVTAPDGRDVRQMVAIDDQARKIADSRLSQVLEELRAVDDQHPEHVLLALLGERLLQDAEQARTASNTKLKRIA